MSARRLGLGRPAGYQPSAGSWVLWAAERAHFSLILCPRYAVRPTGRNLKRDSGRAGPRPRHWAGRSETSLEEASYLPLRSHIQASGSHHLSLTAPSVLFLEAVSCSAPLAVVLTYPAVAFVSFVHRTWCPSSSVQAGCALCSLFSDFFGGFQCQWLVPRRPIDLP